MPVPTAQDKKSPVYDRQPFTITVDCVRVWKYFTSDTALNGNDNESP